MIPGSIKFINLNSSGYPTLMLISDESSKVNLVMVFVSGHILRDDLYGNAKFFEPSNESLLRSLNSSIIAR